MGLITRAVVWVDGQYLAAADLNGELNIIQDEFNGNIDDANIKAAAAIAGSKIAPDFGQQSVTLEELAVDPSNLTNKGRLYTKDVSGGTELFYVDAAGNVIQVTSGGSLSAGGGLPGYIYDCGISNNSGAPTTKVDIATGALEIDVLAANSPEVLEVTSALTIDFATTGANGLDTGSPAINWYYPYVIYDPSGPTIASLASLSSSSPTLPSGYTKFRQVGTFYNTGSGSANIRAFEQVGTGTRRRYIWTGGLVNVVSNVLPTSYTSLGLTGAVSPIADVVNLWISQYTTAGGIEVLFSHDGTNFQASFGVKTGVADMKPAAQVDLIMTAAQTMYHKVRTTNANNYDLDVIGYEEPL